MKIYSRSKAIALVIAITTSISAFSGSANASATTKPVAKPAPAPAPAPATKATPTPTYTFPSITPWLSPKPAPTVVPNPAPVTTWQIPMKLPEGLVPPASSGTAPQFTSPKAESTVTLAGVSTAFGIAAGAAVVISGLSKVAVATPAVVNTALGTLSILSQIGGGIADVAGIIISTVTIGGILNAARG